MMHYNMNILSKTLENGMHVYLVQKPDYKKSVFMLSTGTGGMDIEQVIENKEYKHKTGCAHYLEHQMFRLNGQDVMPEFAKMQSQANAFTSYDVTSYFFQTTSDIYKPLALLMDFVENLDITDASVEKERGIILSEYDMDQQSPETRLIKLNYRGMYKNHPIRENILGTRDDISNMSVKDLTYFYNLNYDPSKLALIGITGQELEGIMDFIEDYQKKYPSKIELKPARIIREEDLNVFEKENEDYMDITKPFICIGYKMKPCQSIQEAIKIDTCIQMKLDSLFSPLNEEYQKWLDARIISQYTGAECDFNVNRSCILFYAQTDQIDAFTNLIDRIVNEIKTKDMNDDVFEALKASYIAQIIRGMDQFDNLAMDLTRAYYENFDFFENIKMSQSVTKEDIKEECQKLDFSNRTITKIYPNEFKSSKNE